MRSRLVLLVVAILLVAGFVALNWSEVMRPSPLLFGAFVADAPLGAILLALLALAVVAFVLSAGTIRTQSLLESRTHYKELQAQRLLADKAEASRFTELRAYLEENLRELRERDRMLTSELQREMRAQTETTNRMLAARLNELEARFDRGGWSRGAATVPVTPLEPVRSEVVHEHAMAEEARQAQLREEERMRDERMRDERIREEPELRREERPGEQPTGWRRWF
ncbi:hypothetical protein GCM10028796_04490 [Ramlibacter monticola]|uniref:LapA family protein n=1 Tax=Ramlibacter monticola TaxID=1926872 RepID=A0A936YXQ8_9BURK|nr:hypothetical protein [Ramlibacter monticola]MBL0391268.1 hypothetical protein [Ramlibacter monticola]